MKPYIFLLFTFLSVYGYSQKNKDIKITAPEMPVDEKTKLVTYSSSEVIPGTAKSELYARALGWFNTFHKNPADVIRMKDAESGQIIGKARFRIYNVPDKTGLKTDAGNVMFTMTVTLSDGRYEYVITECNWKQPSYYPIEKWMDKNSKMYLNVYDHYLMQTDEYMSNMIKNFSETMKVSVK